MNKSLIAYVGSYGAAPGALGGGIYALRVAHQGRDLVQIFHEREPKDAGYLVYAAQSRMLYAVDERKTDGRGPVNPPASVQAFRVMADGALVWRNTVRAFGPRPCHLSHDGTQNMVFSANHGDFQHVERVVKKPDGGFDVEYVYDDSTLTMYRVEADGALGEVADIHVFEGHGKDPNGSPQNGGHAQASPHVHCAVMAPDGRFVIACDKGTDKIHVFRLEERLEIAHTHQMPAETAPRHAAFCPQTGRLFVSCELSSEIASFDFDPDTGTLTPLDRQSSVDRAYEGVNEPAEIRIHPNGRFAYVNNRGEDSLAWFEIGGDGKLARLGHVLLAKSVHPGLAARSFAFSPSGDFMLLADRPAHRVRSYAVDGQSGAVSQMAEFSVPDPAFICFAELSREGDY